MTSRFGDSECKLELSATVVGGVEVADARLEDESITSVTPPEKLLSTERDMAGAGMQEQFDANC